MASVEQHLLNEEACLEAATSLCEAAADIRDQQRAGHVGLTREQEFQDAVKMAEVAQQRCQIEATLALVAAVQELTAAVRGRGL